MTSTEQSQKRRLSALLHETPADPADGARALARARRELQGGAASARELLDREHRFLEGFHATASPALQHDLVAVRRDWLALRIRHLAAAPPTAGVLLDLAETEAAAVAAGEQALVADCRRAIDAALVAYEPTTTLEREVTERFALLTTAIDDVPIGQQVALLRRSGEIVQRLGTAAQSKRCRRLGRRLGRAADDRELARRLERLLGRRGVSVLETTNFVLLLVVLTTLTIEWNVELTPAQEYVFYWIDAVACAFFVADFALELVIHPRRLSWFCRNALTDLVPAIPSVLFLLPSTTAGGAVDNLLLLRVLRLMRVTWAARYVQALRPLFRSARLLLFLVRGLDGLVARFAQLLNREFVFVPAAAEVHRSVVEEDLRDLLFAALRREHELLGLVPRDQRDVLLRERVAEAQAAMAVLEPAAIFRRGLDDSARDVPIGEAVEFLWALRAQDVARWLKPGDVQALDRVVRVLSAVPVRWLPIVRKLAVHPLPETAEERIVALGRRVADWLGAWHGRMLFFADLHGIVTGPQILDRVATALVKASQRPAVRLLLFGGLFSVLRLFSEDNCLSKFVGLPLVLLGGVCLVFLTLGHWLKRLAGQASENYRLTSEAHFISQLERVQHIYEDEDLDFLARRAFGDGDTGRHARRLLGAQLESARTGVPVPGDGAPHHVCLEANRVALLYLHFLDGAPLHESDVKTTEQLLANQSLENLRNEFLRVDGREKKRLRKLKLDDGSLFSGPYLWFRFITESVAVETAKRVAGYNSFCVPLAERGLVEPAALEQMAYWLRRRRDPKSGRTPKERRTGRRATTYPTTEFTALDFLGGDPERDRHLAAVFGEDVLEVVRFDRRTMVREIFGTRPVHHLPKHERSFNPLRFYARRLSRGRVLLAPLLLVWRFVRSVGWLVVKVRQIVREVLDPELAMQRREIGEAPFAVALRKIHRMKAPGLLEAIRLRLRLDPVYAGAPAGWTRDATDQAEPEFERDVRFLHLHEREATHLREEAAEVRRNVAALHAAIPHLPVVACVDVDDVDARRAGELAVTCAWICDKDDARTLLAAERWRHETLADLLLADERGSSSRQAWRAVLRLFTDHPVDAWLRRHGRDLPRNARRVLHEAWRRDPATRRVLAAWQRLPPDTTPTDHALQTLRHAYAHGSAVRRDLIALRTVQSLAVLDVRNYRDLVFRIGDYGADGEDPALGDGLP